MKNKIDSFIHSDVIRDIILDELKLRIPDEVGNVGGIAGDEVIDADDAVPLGDQAIAEVGTEESCATGYDGV